MNPRRLMSSAWSSLLVILGLGILYPAAHAQPSQRPANVLFIAVDDLNACLAVMDPHKQVQTPNLDRLARSGMLFTNAHTPSPSCHPARVAVMTGRCPLHTGITRNIRNAPAYPSWRLSPVLQTAVTLPEFFRSRGYTVKGGGKLFHANQYEAQDENDPAIWDEYFPSLYQQMPFQPTPPFDYFRINRASGRPAGNFDWTPLQVADSEMSDYKVVDWAISQLQKAHSKPFFLGVGIYRPHVPLQVPERYYDLYPIESIRLPPSPPEGSSLPFAVDTDAVIGKWGYDVFKWAEQTGNLRNIIRGYYASVTFADAMIGRLIQALDYSAHANNTIVVLWSDHGWHLGDKMRFEKFTLWRESTRVPLIIRAPGITRPGSTSAQPVNLIDLYPTLMELAGAAAAPELDGISLLPWLQQPDLERSQPSVIVGPEPGSWAAVTATHRYIHYFNRLEEFYDITTDPNEYFDLSTDPAQRPLIDRIRSMVPAAAPEFMPSGSRVN